MCSYITLTHLLNTFGVQPCTYATPLNTETHMYTILSIYVAIFVSPALSHCIPVWDGVISFIIVLYLYMFILVYYQLHICILPKCIIMCQ